MLVKRCNSVWQVTIFWLHHCCTVDPFLLAKFGIARIRSRRCGCWSTSLPLKTPTLGSLCLRWVLFEHHLVNLEKNLSELYCHADLQPMLNYEDSLDVFLFGFYSLPYWYMLCVQILQRILMGTDVVKNVNKNNASHAVLFEALALVSFLKFVCISSMFCDNVASFCHMSHWSVFLRSLEYFPYSIWPVSIDLCEDCKYLSLSYLLKPMICGAGYAPGCW